MRTLFADRLALLALCFIALIVAGATLPDRAPKA
jgi:hypothetical protein